MQIYFCFNFATVISKEDNVQDLCGKAEAHPNMLDTMTQWGVIWMWINQERIQHLERILPFASRRNI